MAESRPRASRDGVGEFVRQWVLVGRRTPYQPGTGAHDLLLTVGGSAGGPAILRSPRLPLLRELDADADEVADHPPGRPAANFPVRPSPPPTGPAGSGCAGGPAT